MIVDVYPLYISHVGGHSLCLQAVAMDLKYAHKNNSDRNADTADKRRPITTVTPPEIPIIIMLE